MSVKEYIKQTYKKILIKLGLLCPECERNIINYKCTQYNQRGI